MTAAALKERFLWPVWLHLRGASWPLLPLGLVAVLGIARVAGAASYAYWNDWLTCFVALLASYALVACLRIVLQSFCFDKAAACWIALVAAIVIASGPALHFAMRISWIGVPSHIDFLPLYGGILAAGLLVVPAEIRAERDRWARRAADAAARQRREAAIERQLVEARLTALQGQIEPHFLYNTLANARALIRQDAAAAELLLGHLIRFLRSAMPDLRTPGTTLDQELDRAHAWLDIIQMRMKGRLRFEIAAGDEARACLVPPLSVMTLVENAVEHGIEPKVGGGTVRISAGCAQGRLCIEVSDDGIGFRAEAGDGVGLANLQQRLAALYGEEAELRIEPGPAGGVRASIELPAGAMEAA